MNATTPAVVSVADIGDSHDPYGEVVVIATWYGRGLPALKGPWTRADRKKESKEHNMNAIEMIRRAWAALLGGVAVRFSFLLFVPPLATVTADLAATWVAVLLGAGAGVFADIVLSRSLSRTQPVEASAAP